MQTQGFSFSRRGLKGENISSVANPLRGKERIESVVCAEVEHGHPLAQEAIEELNLCGFEFALDNWLADVVVACKPPCSEW